MKKAINIKQYTYNQVVSLQAQIDLIGDMKEQRGFLMAIAYLEESGKHKLALDMLIRKAVKLGYINYEK